METEKQNAESLLRILKSEAKGGDREAWNSHFNCIEKVLHSMVLYMTLADSISYPRTYTAVAGLLWDVFLENLGAWILS